MSFHEYFEENGIVSAAQKQEMDSSPFLDSPTYGGEKEIEEHQISTTEYLDWDSPFTDGEIGGSATTNTDVLTPEDEIRAQLQDELMDEEFTDAIEGLITEAETIMEGQMRQFPTGQEAFQAQHVESYLTDHFAPLASSTELFMDQIMQEMEAFGQHPATEEEVDQIFDRVEQQHQINNPAFEDFFRKLGRKLKKIAKKAVKVVKKGIKIATKFTPLGLLMGRLKRLVRPFLKFIIRKVIRKLPRSLQPIARRIAKGFGIRTEMELAEAELQDALMEDETYMEQTEIDSAEIQQEFDLAMIDELFVVEGGPQHESEIEYFVSDKAPNALNTELEYEAARERFVQEMMQLETGQNPAPQIERFVGTILTVARMGIRLIGRKKVVNLLAGLVAKLIKRWVGASNAKKLSRVLVDKGMSLLNLETPQENQDRLGPEAIAQTIEEVVEAVAAADEEVLTDDELLQGFVLEAFENSVAENFPSDILQPEIREVAKGGGIWQLKPNGKRKRYKKYSKVLEVELTKQKAKNVRTFGGQRLSRYLQMKFGMKLEQPVKVRVHLYQALRGTRLTQIAFHEKHVKGLGSGHPTRRKLFHPLTKQAAGTLLGLPGLGKATSKRFLRNRRRIGVGQRFYYLEVVGAPMSALPSGSKKVTKGVRNVEQSDVFLKLDYTRSNIKVAVTIPEMDAVEMAKRIKAGDYVSAAVRLRKVLREAFRNVFFSNLGRNVKIVKEAGPELYLEDFLGKAKKAIGKAIMEKAIKMIVNLTIKAIQSFFKRVSNDFVTAQKHPAQGVTITVNFIGAPILGALNLINKFKESKPISLGDVTNALSVFPTPDVSVSPGHKSV